MRNFAFLIGLYFALLALMPCQDKEDVSASETYISIQKDQPAHTQKDQDSCPPFCSCYCCSTVRHISSKVAAAVFSKPLMRTYPDLAVFAVLEQSLKIWQPPRLA